MPRGIHNTGVKQNNIVFEPQILENKVVTTSNNCQRSARRTYGGLCHRGLPKCSMPSIANKPQHCKIHNEGSTFAIIDRWNASCFQFFQPTQ